jgi:hypothetical protein
MGKPYSQDLRERVIAAVDTGTGAYVAALLFQVSLLRRRKTGEVTARRSGCGPKPKLVSRMPPMEHYCARLDAHFTLALPKPLKANTVGGPVSTQPLRKRHGCCQHLTGPAYQATARLP